MLVSPGVYRRLAEIQVELLRSASKEPAGETVALMREGVTALRQFQGADAERLEALAKRLSETSAAPSEYAADRDWLTDQIGHALTTWNEWRREPWLED